MELYNPTDSDVDITGWTLSDSKVPVSTCTILQPTVVKAGGYKLLWFDHYDAVYSPYNLDMKLDVDGGSLTFIDTNGQEALSVTYPAGVARCSWALTESGLWNYCTDPTPGKSNVGCNFCSTRLKHPEVSCNSLFFSEGSVAFNVEIPVGCILRYTTDCTAPTLSNGETSFTGSFEVDETTVFKFCLFQEGALPSAVVTRSFIKSDYPIDLPILTVAGSEKDFFGDSLGIFVSGVNGKPGSALPGNHNFNMDWDRPATMEYFTSQGELLFSQDVDVERAGGFSRSYLPWSFKLKGNKVYEGKKNLEYPFFAEKPYIKNRTLQIRNGGNDNECRVIDPFIQQLIATSGIDVDYQSYQPVAHFINGVWKGAINMREPSNKHFVYANYGYDSEEIDQFEISPDLGRLMKCGTSDAFDQMYTLSKTATNQASYAAFCNLVDIDAYCNYMALQLFLGREDWPQNNLKGWRPRVDGGKWRFVLFDLDSVDDTSNSFTRFEKKQTYHNLEQEMVTIFFNLLNNNEFRKKFIDTYCLVCYSVFEEERCRSLIEEMAHRVAPTQALFQDETPWESVNFLYSIFTPARQEQQMKVLKEFARMKLTKTEMQHATIASTNSLARISFNGIDIPTGKFDGKFFSPVTVCASVVPGYSFEGWDQVKRVSEPMIRRGDVWRYYDQGTLDAYPWNTMGYDDLNWDCGAAPLGFGASHSDLKTLLDYGGTASNKRPTYYLRKNIHLDRELQENEAVVLECYVEDGCVVMVNGIEACRYNLPRGEVSYSDFALSYANNGPDRLVYHLDRSLFVAGDNVIAVEVHAEKPSTTRLYWDATLTKIIETERTRVTTSLDYALPTKGDIDVEACYTEMTEMDGVLAHVVINEVSADNTTAINDYHKKSDWVELYNPTNKAVDLAGMYLTDNLEKPHKYCISNGGQDEVSTIIPAHGFKIIWCDKQSPIRELHASFKLENGDRQRLVLTAADDSWSDTLLYCTHDGTETVGRYPDGSRDVYLMTRPTIGKPNIRSSYSLPCEQLPFSNYEFSMSNAGWGTLCLPFDFDVPNGLEIYTVENVSDNDELVLFEEDQGEAYKPYLVAGEPSTYLFSGDVEPEPDGALLNGLLVGTLSPIYAPKGSYVLQSQNEIVGFYQVSQENLLRVPAYRAYLKVHASSSAHFRLPDEGVDNIEDIAVLSETMTVYDVYGRKIHGMSGSALRIGVEKDGTGVKIWK